MTDIRITGKKKGQQQEIQYWRRMKNIYVINVVEESERLRLFKKNAEKYDIKYEIFPAVRFSDPRLLKQLENINDNTAKKACEISNRLSFADILSKNFDESCIIFEDDCVFEPQAKEQIEKVLSELPDDFGICYLGCYIREKIQLEKYSKPLVKIKKCGKIWGATGIIFSGKARRFLSEKLLSEDSDITDFEIVKSVIPNFACFISNPMICFQSVESQKVTKYKMHGTFDFETFKQNSIDYFNHALTKC